MKSKKYTFTMPSTLIEKARKVAIKNYMTLSGFVREALKNEIRKRK